MNTNKIIRWILLTTAITLLIYFVWLSLRPIKIIAVHQDRNFSSVLVNHFPFTVQGKIDWWLENKVMLKSLYGIPKPASYGGFTINFWLFDDGYKEDQYDRLCFNDMNTDKNCIEKHSVLTVHSSKNLGLFFTANNENYRVKDDTEIIRIDTE